nr:NAD(P)H-dependent oxidoreductase subunit E [uncultured Desulfobulbus sp.]
MPASPRPTPPSDETRWHLVDRVMQRLDNQPSALIETLHAAQGAFGFLEKTTLSYIAARLHLPPAKVFGVATFYNHFTLKPKGEHTLAVCTGTACHLKGNDRLLDWMEERYHLAPGGTTTDNRLSLVEVRCVGACALAPVFLTDNRLIGKKSFAEATAIIREWLDDES